MIRLLSPRLLLMRLHPTSTLFPYTTLFRSPAPLHGASERPVRFLSVDERRRGERVRRQRLVAWRSEEHTSELQSRRDLVCRLLLEKKKKIREHTREFKQKGNSLRCDVLHAC